MSKRYAIWDKQSPVITPSGAVYTAEQWIAKRPAAGLDSVKVICAAGEINGAIYDTLGALKQRAEQQGCTFDGDETDQETLDKIEAFEEERAAEAAAAAAQPTAEERIAAAMEYQNLLSM